MALAAIHDGATRTEAARIGGVTLQIVRHWVIELNARGPGGLVDGTLALIDCAYAGQRVATASSIAIGVVRKPLDQVGFAVQPWRWAVKRSFAWLGRNRRLAKDYEPLTPTAEAFLHAAASIILPRRPGRC